jgi:hypothetical protein
MTGEWWSIEVFDAEISASAWRDAYREALVESALTNGALQWHWHEHTWGVVFEISFADEEHWLTWRYLPGTRAALDAAPDPANGLLIYRGRGGSSGAFVRRRPWLPSGASAMELPEPTEDQRVALVSVEPEEPYARSAQGNAALIDSLRR